MIHIDQVAPSFQNITAYWKGAFKKVHSSDFANTWLVLFFYPRDFTFVCPTEIRGYAKLEQEFKNAGATILAASTDSEWSHKAWFERDLPEVQFPVLADTSQRLARDFDVYNEAEGLAERGLFIIDPNGIVKYILISAGSVGRSAKETLRVLKALQSGDLCPMEWEPGEGTLGKA